MNSSRTSGALVRRRSTAREQRERIEPVVDATAPQHELVVGRDTGDDALERRARSARGGASVDAERDDVDQPSQAGVVVVGPGVDAPERRELTEPEVALLVARAQEEVTAQQLLVERRRRALDRQPAAGVVRFLALFELLEVHRVVHVGDEDAIRVRDERSADEHPPLEHEDVAPLHELAELRRSPGAHPESVAWSIGGDGAHQLDVVLASQRLRHLP